MGKRIDRLRGVVRVEAEGVFIEKFLNACACEGLSLWNFELKQEYLLNASAYEAELDDMKRIAEKSGCELEILKLEGGSRNIKFLTRRKWAALFFVFALLLLLLSSFFVWQIEIYGGEEISRAQVLRALDSCGVKPGVFRFSFSPDLVRSKMMLMVPDIGWMAINISGSKAKVLLEKRLEKPEIYEESDGGYLIAARTGIIRNMSVFNGKALVKDGQSVLRGETLVSGVMESTVSEPRYVNARARVMADTWYEITALCPAQAESKDEIKRSYNRYSVKIGKKRLNFYFSGRKDIDECDKIIYEYNLGIDGVFALPVSVIRETLVRYKSNLKACDISEEIASQIKAELEDSVDGNIISSSYTCRQVGDLSYITVRAACYENIAERVSALSAQQT